MTMHFASGLRAEDLRAFGVARVREAAYDAVQTLWRRRKAEGWQQSDIAEALDRDAAWVSRNLRGPGNWTLKTFGEFIAALGGEADIKAHGLEDTTASNFDAYDGYGVPPLKRLSFAETADNPSPSETLSVTISDFWHLPPTNG